MNVEVDGKQSKCRQYKEEPTFTANNRSWGCLKANNSSYIVIGQNNQSDTVRTGQNTAASFSIGQADYNTFIIFWLWVI